MNEGIVGRFCRALFLGLGCILAQAQAQGTFQNLDFEATTIQPGSTPGEVLTSMALPGWTAYWGTNPQSTIFFNITSLGNTWISLLDTNRSVSGGAIEGLFGVELVGGIVSVGGNPLPMAASIAQTGLVPITAMSLRFKSFRPSGGPPLELWFGGQKLSFSLLSLFGPLYAEYGADISAFRGQMAELRFTVPPINNAWDIDSIVLSSQAVPEPSSAALLAAAFGVLRFLERRRSRCRRARYPG